MAHTVEIRPRARRDVKRLPQDIQVRLIAKIRSLASNPRPRGVIKMEGPEGTYRMRVGNYRIIYDIHDEHKRVLVVRVRHRRDVYRK